MANHKFAHDNLELPEPDADFSVCIRFPAGSEYASILIGLLRQPTLDRFWQRDEDSTALESRRIWFDRVYQPAVDALISGIACDGDSGEPIIEFIEIEKLVERDRESDRMAICISCGCGGECNGSSLSIAEETNIGSNPSSVNTTIPEQYREPTVGANSDNELYACALKTAFVQFMHNDISVLAAGSSNALNLANTNAELVSSIVEGLPFPIVADLAEQLINTIGETPISVLSDLGQIYAGNDFLRRSQQAMTKVVGARTNLSVNRNLLNGWVDNLPVVWGAELIPVQFLARFYANTVDLNRLQTEANILWNDGDPELCAVLDGKQFALPFNPASPSLPVLPESSGFELIPLATLPIAPTGGDNGEVGELQLVENQGYYALYVAWSYTVEQLGVTGGEGILIDSGTIHPIRSNPIKIIDTGSGSGNEGMTVSGTIIYTDDTPSLPAQDFSFVPANLRSVNFKDDYGATELTLRVTASNNVGSGSGTITWGAIVAIP